MLISQDVPPLGGVKQGWDGENEIGPIFELNASISRKR